jgi:hypothetical protein
VEKPRLSKVGLVVKKKIKKFLGGGELERRKTICARWTKEYLCKLKF